MILIMEPKLAFYHLIQATSDEALHNLVLAVIIITAVWVDTTEQD